VGNLRSWGLTKRKFGKGVGKDEKIVVKLMENTSVGPSRTSPSEGARGALKEIGKIKKRKGW